MISTKNSSATRLTQDTFLGIGVPSVTGFGNLRSDSLQEKEREVKMKKIIMVMLVLLLAALAVGCSREGNKPSINQACYEIIANDSAPFYADSYEIQAGAVILEGYYEPTGFIALDWKYVDQILVLSSEKIEITER